MSKRFIISLIVVGILTAVSIWAFAVSSKLTTNIKQVSNDPDISDEKVNIEELVITETREGQKFWEIYASSGIYDNTQNQAILTDIKGNFYKNNKVVLSFESPLGIYNEKSKEVKLTGEVKAATDSKIFISSKELSWIGSNNKLIANKDVKIRQSNRLQTTGDKAIFTTDFTSFKITGNTQTNVYTNN